MKLRITLVLVLAMIVSATTFATSIKNDKVSKNIENAFTQQFKGAKEVTWSNAESYTKANFQLNGEFFSAYYTKAGEFMGTGRNLPSAQLPEHLKVDLKKNFSGEWISELFEYTNEEETLYFATMENADQTLLLRSIDGYSWMTIKKVKKN